MTDWQAIEDGLTLRPYQVDGLERARNEFRAGRKRIVICAPTGAGKTQIAAAILCGAMRKGVERVAFIADLTALIDQSSARFYDAGIPHGVWAGGIRPTPSLPVQVCSAQTLSRRKRWPWHQNQPPQLVIVDECHDVHKWVAAQLKDIQCHAVGLSATPLTLGLGKVYESVINVRTTMQLLDQHWLVPIEAWHCHPIDMEGAAVNKFGEWTDKECEERGIKITGSVVSDWIQRVNERFDGQPPQTLVFGATAKHCTALVDEFREAGYDFRPVGTMADPAERAQTDRDFRAGNCVGLVTCEAIGKGYDAPAAKILIDCRAYRKAFARHVQKIGRVMRPFANKRVAILHDHCGNYRRFLWELMDFWERGCTELDTGKRQKKAPAKPREKKDILCPNCKRLMTPEQGNTCPECGEERPVAVDWTEQIGEMEKVIVPDLPKDLWPHVAGYALERLHRFGDADRQLRFAKAQYKQLTGSWPKRTATLDDGLYIDEVDRGVISKIKSQIAAFKIRRRALEERARQ